MTAALADADSYPLGSVFWQVDNGDESKWTTEPWGTNGYVRARPKPLPWSKRRQAGEADCGGHQLPGTSSTGAHP